MTRPDAGARPHAPSSPASPKRRRWAAALLPIAVLGTLAAWVLRRKPRSGGSPIRDHVLMPTVTLIDRAIGWHRLPWPLGLPMIFALMGQLRRGNLHDPSTITPARPRPPLVPEPGHLAHRTADGTFNDLARPEMGSAGMRFGRNVPVAATMQEAEGALLSPNPRVVSRELMTRDTFTPAETLNVFAAAWIQFMVRDWFSHGIGARQRRWELPLAADDPWPAAGAERIMGIPRTPEDTTRPEAHTGTPRTFLNTETHWWDGSQIYGNSAAHQRLVRSGVDGKLRVDDDDLPVIDPLLPMHPADVAGFWLGMALLGILFIREHNAICDRLKEQYPRWPDEELFQHARLVNAALMAKIHTVEWTTALLDHPTMVRALRADWWGLAGERFSRIFGRVGDGELISGVLGSKTEHFGAPYAITEEFVAVYRMHPLIPDDYTFRAAADHRVLGVSDFEHLTKWHAIDVLRQIPLGDLFYSFGVAHPGAIQLHNFPKGLQEYVRPDGELQDLAATDILRTRELGVPRYNAFREMLHLPRVATFEAMTEKPEWAEELRRVYGGDVDRVDLIAGMFAEPTIPGFAFSETAFRIFVLMAPRRLKSDRFFTNDFTANIYSQTGLDWIADNTFGTVVQRHFPELQPALRGVKNAFKPWRAAAVA